jgi:CARDB
MWRRLAWPLVSASMLALVVLPASAQAAKPDLVISSSSGLGREWAFQGGAGNATFSFGTKNLNKPANPFPANAKSSVTKLTLDHADRRYPLAHVTVPPLAPGNLFADSVPGVDEPDLRFNYPIGSYAVEICADATNVVAESNEDNNCDLVSNPARFNYFYVAKRGWDGTLSGNAPLVFGSDVIERWKSLDAGFAYAKYEGSGVFDYDFTGTVTWTVSGTDPAGCTWSGGATKPVGLGGAPVTGNLTTDYLRQKYHGTTTVGATLYTIHQTCHGVPGASLPGPLARSFWTTGVTGTGALLPFPWGSTALTGPATAPGGQTYVWDLG